MDYLQVNAPGLEVEYEDFLSRVELECEDPKWNAENHPARKILDRFSPMFKLWVSDLERVSLWKRAGYPLAREDLEPLDWSALAVLESFKRNPARPDP
jgi:hypothetical protein